MHYNNPFHGPSVLGVLNEQRLSGQMCDMVLVVGNQRYQAHRSVLAASSEYFQALFTRMDAEVPEVIHLDFCEADAFEIVLNYMYSSSLFVDKGSLAAIQELGYSLGIPFLTNIASTRPHVSYYVSRKRLSYSEEDETDGQTRSVIVCRTRGERKTAPSSAVSSKPEAPGFPSHHKAPSVSSKATGTSDSVDRKPVFPYSSILKGDPLQATMVRPQLTSSVSFSDVEIQHIGSQPGGELGLKDEDPFYHGGSSYPGGQPGGEHSQAIDRSGPLIKSLLRRSLSMDSPVPVFSPTLELRDPRGREHSVVKLASKATGPDTSEHNGGGSVLRSKYLGRYDEHSDAQVDEGVRVKAEPGSPLADPLEIVRITIGDTLPVNLKHFQPSSEQGSRPGVETFGKRRARADNRRYPFKKSRGLNERRPSDNMGAADDVVVEAMAPQNPSLDGHDNDNVSVNDNDNVREPHQGKPFISKCWNCLKVFRSNAGLHRHVNMYHNPEKPYACEICHKRFHTNFKVWTHCQTQHGVMQNPASSSSASTMDEKFQKRLIDMVREREIKKALLWKLKRNKQGLQSPKVTKNRPKAKLMCPYCGKGFMFQSQYKQHLRTHPDENQEQEQEDAVRESAVLYQKPDAAAPEKDGGDVFACRLCNVRLASFSEQGDHERGCRHATVCPYCGLRFSSTEVKKEHEAHCKYKKLTCLECMRTFKSSFSIWRHHVEVHNQNMMTGKDQLSLGPQGATEDGGGDDDCGEDGPGVLGHGQYGHDHMPAVNPEEDLHYRHSSIPPIYDSEEDSSSYVPEDLSMGHHGELVVKEEPMEEAVCELENVDAAVDDNNGGGGTDEAGVWPCEKCGNLFSSHKDLERHQELLCHIKPFICHLCNKAFRTNFRLWSHFQSHMSAGDDAGAKGADDRRPSSPSPSPPPTPQTATADGPPAPQVLAAAKPAQNVPVPVPSGGGSSPEPGGSSECKGKEDPDMTVRKPGARSPLSRSNSAEPASSGTQESDTLFYHAPTLSAMTFKRQYMCKLCHRTFKTAFSLWSHEQSHGHL